MGTIVESDIDQFIQEHKQKLQQERNQLNHVYDPSRYKEGDQGISPSGRKQWDRGKAKDAHPAEEPNSFPKPEATSLLLGSDDREKRKLQLQSERHKEYNEILENQQRVLPDENRHNVAEDKTSGAEDSLHLNLDDSKRQKLYDEKKQEYLEYVAKQQARGHQAEVFEGTGATLPVGEYTDEKRQKLQAERQREYVELQQKKLSTDRQKGLPPKPATPNHFFKNIGQYNKQVQMLNEERKREYNQKLAERGILQTGQDSKREGTVPYEGELEVKNTGLAEGKSKEVFATLPGLNYSVSVEIRKKQQRNKEYNEYLRQKGGRKEGWTTPTYEEILDKKQQYSLTKKEEFGGLSGIRRYASEGAINKVENDSRDREVDKDFETRKISIDDEMQHPGDVLDDNLLDPEGRENEYNQLVAQPSQSEEMASRVRQPSGQFLASLPVGHHERDSAKRRRQTDYRRDLLSQMEESKAAKNREKVHDLRVNFTGLHDPAKNSNRSKGITGEPRASLRRGDNTSNDTKFLLDDGGDYDPFDRLAGDYGARSAPPPSLGDQGFGLGSLGLNDFGFRSSHGGRAGSGRGHRRERDTDFLDRGGLDGILESRRPIGSVNPPPGLMYQPSFQSGNTDRGTYVTAGGGGVGGPYSSIDEAYHYYGLKNPLDVDTGDVVSNLNLRDYAGGGGRGVPNQRSSPAPRVKFADEPISSQRSKSKEYVLPYQFRSDDDTKPQNRQELQNYGAELEKQIAEKRLQKMREKEEQARYEKKLDEDIANYNPFGRGGGGAPIKDESGNAIADLRSLQRGTYNSPRQQRNSSPSYSPRPPSPRDDKIKLPPSQQTAAGDPTFARGGHGIFGQPKTDAEKDQSEKYKDELRNQIAEKRRRDQIEKEREKSEEEKENKRLEDQRKRIQEEFDAEQRKTRAKEEEVRQKNEELRKAADERKKDAQLKKRESEDSRMREQQEQLERERREKEQQAGEAEGRLKSPPVPTFKTKTEQHGKPPPSRTNHRGRDSPSTISLISQRTEASPVPGGPSSQRPGSSDVLTQLATMRKQLQNERHKVENALLISKNEPDVFDPRTVQKLPQNKLIFENAVNKNASLHSTRAPTSDIANARNIQQFNELKFKEDTESRKAFRSMFPEAPVTNTTLETQQDAMIRQQEAQLRALRDKNVYDPTPANVRFSRHGNTSVRSQLAANSAFIDTDVNGLNHFPEDFDDIASRNDSARARQRDRFVVSPGATSFNAMGSQVSFDVERIHKRNEERLRKLQQLTTTDDISMTDPDDVLDRFMAKQRYNRPPSGHTLQDDSWLRPGSKVL